MLQSLQDLLLRIPLVLRYGLALSLGVVILKTLEYQFLSFRFSIELYTGLLALFFLLLGLASGYAWVSVQRTGNAVEAGVLEPLTATEQRVLNGLVDGCSNQQLADRNNVSINTVKTHLKNIYKKLQVSNRAEAVMVARKMALA